MKEKIAAFLKTKLAGFAGGVEEAFLMEYAEHYSKSITEEPAIATTLTDGVIDQMKVAYSFYNKAVVDKTKKAQDTALKNFREKHGLDENGKPIETPDPKKKEVKTPDPDEPAWFKSYRESKDAELAELKTKFESQEKEKSRSALMQKFTAHEKVKSIPASFLKGRNLAIESEDQIDQLAAAVEADFNAFRQDLAEQGVVMSIPPAGVGSTKEGEAIGKSIAEKKNANSSDGVKGKEV